MKQRIDYIDEISGLLIAAMVAIHIAGHTGYGEAFLDRLFFFFMPWFYFKAGYFFKTKENRQALQNSIRRFIYPYLCFTIIALTISLLLDSNVDTLTTNLKVLVVSGAVMANIPLWFVISLFIIS